VRILVTGGTGRVGAEVVKELQKRKADVRLRVEHFKDVPHFASKLAIENALRQFDVPFTIIRPNYFSQNDATLKDSLTKAGICPMPLGDVGVSAVDIRDIAEATAIVLTSDGHTGKTYNLNGPGVLSGPLKRHRSGAICSAKRFVMPATT
jgi:uncharacterized protein YbjT (DUF2867 family)